MLLYTLVLFIALQLLGVLFLAWTGAITSVIPAFIADVFLACFLLGIKPSWRKHAMHAGLTLALIVALIGLVMGCKGLFDAGETGIRWRAVLEQFVMAGLCAGYLALGIRSFILARRARQAEGAPPAEPASAPASHEPVQRPTINLEEEDR